METDTLNPSATRQLIIQCPCCEEDTLHVTVRENQHKEELQKDCPRCGRRWTITRAFKANRPDDQAPLRVQVEAWAFVLAFDDPRGPESHTREVSWGRPHPSTILKNADEIDADADTDADPHPLDKRYDVLDDYVDPFPEREE